MPAAKRRAAPPIALDSDEHKILAIFEKLTDSDPEGAWTFYYPEIYDALDVKGDWVDYVCRRLRQRKLLSGTGRAGMSSYWISDKGRLALKQARS